VKPYGFQKNRINFSPTEIRVQCQNSKNTVPKKNRVFSKPNGLAGGLPWKPHGFQKNRIIFSRAGV